MAFPSKSKEREKLEGLLFLESVKFIQERQNAKNLWFTSAFPLLQSYYCLKKGFRPALSILTQFLPRLPVVFVVQRHGHLFEF